VVRLAEACERALVASARSARAASRQQMRAAARRFVRRHRRDTGYLAWVLRSVGASSALAVALLGIGAQPALAKAPLWQNAALAYDIISAPGSFQGFDPAAGDLDADGDLDFAVGNGDEVLYLENTGGPTSPALVERTGAANPFQLVVGADIRIYVGLGDLDADGDLDLLAGGFGTSSNLMRYYENTGSPTSAAFVLRTGAQSPVEDLDFDNYLYPNPTLADLDTDGDLDLTIGAYNLQYYENTGTALQPGFVERTGADLPFFETAVTFDYSEAAPALGDLDGDGDLDLVSGAYVTTVGHRYFENTGSPTSPDLIERSRFQKPFLSTQGGYFSKPVLGDLDSDGDLDVVFGVGVGSALRHLENISGRFAPRFANVFGSIDVGVLSRPAFGDLDGDSDLDLVVGESGGSFRTFRRTTSPYDPWVFYVPVTGSANPLDGKTVGSGGAAPALGDLDADGDRDLISGAVDGGFAYFENTGSAANAAFAPGSTGPIGSVDVGNHSRPSLGDLDGDGDLDLVAGEALGLFHYLENTGSDTSPAFALRTGAQNPLDGVDVGDLAAPALGDYDGDGDLDLVAGAGVTFRYFENTGSATSPAFLAHTGAASPIDGVVASGHASPAAGDIDGDGDVDVLAGESSGQLDAYSNAIVKRSLSAFELVGAANPLAGADVGTHATSTLGDLDADGDLDLIAGAVSDPFRYFENTGSALLPRFVQRTGGADPFDGQAAGIFHAPVLADLDADGDLDVVAGSSSETASALLFFENTGDSITPAFVVRTGSENPLDGLDAGTLPRPALGDLDADGDLDVVVGVFDGSLLFFANTGDAENPAFALTGPTPLDVGDLAAPALGDVDEDGDLDLVIGNADGALAYLENTGDAANATFVARTGDANPFGAFDVGENAATALGDLDADGDLDVVAGAYSGALRTFYLPEPSHGALLGAGAALLARLAGRRPRRG
jgi:hypothetical protein